MKKLSPGLTQEPKPLRHSRLRSVLEFVQVQGESGRLLLAAMVVAVLGANLSPSYNGFFTTPIARGWGVREVVNEGLMAFFFLLVGLEIKREILAGQLQTVRQASLPLVAALGGMIAPALLFLLLNGGTPHASAWGIPVATDIALSLGVLRLAHRQGGPGSRLFLTSVAIVDDLGAVVVIALFYSASIGLWGLGIAFVAVAFLGLLARRGYFSWILALAAGLAAWGGFLNAGIHPSLAGVLLALAIRYDPENDDSPLTRLEHALGPWVAHAVVPLFALANAGVSLQASFTDWRLVVGIVLGLMVGKPLGIVVTSRLALRMKWSDWPRDVNRQNLWGLGALGGIGLTMSLFIAQLAVPDSAQLQEAKLAVLVGSLGSALLGALLLRNSTSHAPTQSS